MSAPGTAQESVSSDRGGPAPWAGAGWLRCDLHVHTPLDPSRNFGEDVAAVLQAADTGKSAKLRALAFKFFDACRAAGLDLVALTDHNECRGHNRLLPFLPDWRNERNAELAVLPGVEVTVGGERILHVLLVTEPRAAAWLQDDYLSAVFSAKDRFTTAGKKRQPRSCGRSLADFITFTRGCFEANGYPHLLLPAHVNRGSGIEREIRSTISAWEDELSGLTRLDAFSHADWAGFQVCGDVGGIPKFMTLLQHWAARVRYQRAWEDLTPVERRAIGGTQHWPLLEASDPKSYADIGSRHTYLKMEVPSVEGVRLALLDPESRLRTMAHGPPALEHSAILGVHIHGTDFYDDVKAGFSPNLNTIIGGRGTGKSTLLELIRYGLDRARPEDYADEEADIRKRVDALLRSKARRDAGQTPGVLLPGHRVEIDVVVAQRRYRIVRDANAVRVLDADGQSVGGDVRALIAPRVLSQRQIARIGEDPAAQRRELDHLAQAGDDTDHRRARRDLIDKLVLTQSRRAALQERFAALREKETQLQRTRDQIAMLETEGSKELFDSYRGYQAERRWLDESLNRLVEARARIELLDKELAEFVADPAPKGPNRTWASGFAKQIDSAVALARVALTPAAATLSEARDAATAERDATWLPRLTEVETQYQELEARLAGRGTTFGAHKKLLQQRALLEREVQVLRKLPAEIAAVQTEIAAQRDQLVDWHRRRADRRTQAGDALRQAGADLRVTVVPFGDRDDFARRRDAWFGGSGIRDRDWDVLVDHVFGGASEEVPDRLNRLVAGLRQDVARLEALGGTADQSQLVTADLLGRRWTQLTGFFVRALEQPDRLRLDEAERFLPEDQVLTEVRDAEGEFKPIEQGSLGQRSTAVLSLLLTAQREPLLIDQPEEDLDNQYVYDVVVDLLRKRKFSRQLILATHNANIPVNGDAELILGLAVRDSWGVVEVAGSIDRPEVKDEVSRVMEGSVEAFRLRQQRYGY